MQTTSFPLEGCWHPLRAEFDGQHAPEMALQKTTLSFTRETYALRFGGEVADAGTFALGTNEEQLLITLRATQGENAGRTIPAIAQLRGDRLRICFGMDGVLPVAFSTGIGSHRYLVTYRRVAVA